MTVDDLEHADLIIEGLRDDLDQARGMACVTEQEAAEMDRRIRTALVLLAETACACPADEAPCMACLVVAALEGDGPA